jgi:hypothetical protein
MDLTQIYLSSINSMVFIALPNSTSRIVYLPPASSILGQSFWVSDGAAQLGRGGNILWLSTVGIDKFDNTKTLMALSTQFQSTRFYAQNLSNYVVLQNSAYSW